MATAEEKRAAINRMMQNPFVKQVIYQSRLQTLRDALDEIEAEGCAGCDGCAEAAIKKMIERMT